MIPSWSSPVCANWRRDVAPELERLKVKALSKCRDFLMDRIYDFRKPKTNVQVDWFPFWWWRRRLVGGWGIERAGAGHWGFEVVQGVWSTPMLEVFCSRPRQACQVVSLAEGRLLLL